MPILVIGGPTATGKSSLAMDVAREWDAVIVSVDAMTVYRDLNIGTAKPSIKELQEIQHFCVDIRDIDQEFTVGDFVEIIDQVVAEYPRVIIAGGTPYYLNALFRPMAPLPPANPEIRERLEKLEEPYQQLQEVDPVIAKKLHPNDRVRIIRALEVFEITGRPMSEVQKDPPKRKPLDAKIFWIDHENLRERIGKRINLMLEEGYLEECQRIIDEGWNLREKPLLSFSYKFLLQHLKGELILEEALEKTEIGTWHLARKQRIWGRNIGWPIHSIEEAREQVFHWIKEN